MSRWSLILVEVLQEHCNEAHPTILWCSRACLQASTLHGLLS